ncbi:serine/threonine protein phosphatase [Amycolatopsis antarctica]|uniref:Serine/threonine protein phosphatase n=2 Tax=Amycolatopsis antarctica TaxID=1854586 RepID=A0A263CXT0_9PSEU|nr:serine/threonine protein phosphatase [Amycolatopsis antarctica]
MIALFDGRGAQLTSADADGRITGPLEIGLVDEERSGLDRIRRVGQTELLHVALAPDSSSALGTMIPDDAMRETAAGLRPADVLGVGLNARGGTIGALVVVRGERRGYDEQHIDLVEEFARRAAVTLDSGRLYEERVHVASVLQASLRPPRLPAIPGGRVAARYRAAQEHMDIGGDFYDVHGSGEEYSLIVGDVCGKGVDAAVLTGRARQTVRTAAHFDRSPSRILTALNEVLHEEESDRFVTLACASVRPDATTGGLGVRLAVAGHPAPFVLRAGGTVEQPEITGTLSGVLPGLRYDEIGVELLPGDQMLFFTDGIYEAKGPGGFFGMERLGEMLAPYAGAAPEILCEAVEQRVVEHLAGAAHDDMALLALRAGSDG